MMSWIMAKNLGNELIVFLAIKIEENVVKLFRSNIAMFPTWMIFNLYTYIALFLNFDLFEKLIEIS